MKLSKYVYIFPYVESEMLVYNPTNGCLIVMDANHFSDGTVIEARLLPSDLSILNEGGFTENDDEILGYLKQNYAAFSDQLVLSIELTGKCNLNCTYCYQHSWKKRENISKEIIEKIAEYVEKCTDLMAYRRVKIDFIGGEPFLATDMMNFAYYKIKNICDRKNISLEIQIETNGTLITYENIKMFHNLNLQVTLSLPGDHNNLRPYKNGKGTYDKIISNLIECRNLFEKHSINLTIRYNVHSRNYMFFPSFLEELKKLRIPVKTIKTSYTDEYKYNNFKNGLTMEEYIAWNSNNAIDTLVNQGIHIAYFPQASIKRCEAYQPFCCKIFSDGFIGLCNASKYGTSKLNIYELAENPEVLNEHFKKIKEWSPLDEPECYQCKHLILCGGKTFCRENPCTYSPYQLEDYLKQYIKNSEMGLGNLFLPV